MHSKSHSTDSPPRTACAGLSPNSLALRSPSIQSPPSLNPPISVVYVGGKSTGSLPTATMPRSVIKATTSPLRSPRLNTSQGSTTTATSATTPASGFFRLQPRNTLSFPLASPMERNGDTESGRTRKRSAGSLHDGKPGSLNKTELPIFAWSSSWKSTTKATSPEQSPNDALNLQGLSLKSPSPPRPPTGRETEAQQQSLAFSSFSRYSHSPGHSVAKAASSTEGTESRSDEAMHEELGSK